MRKDGSVHCPNCGTSLLPVSSTSNVEHFPSDEIDWRDLEQVEQLVADTILHLSQFDVDHYSRPVTIGDVVDRLDWLWTNLAMDVTSSTKRALWYIKGHDREEPTFVLYFWWEPDSRWHVSTMVGEDVQVVDENDINDINVSPQIIAQYAWRIVRPTEIDNDDD